MVRVQGSWELFEKLRVEAERYDPNPPDLGRFRENATRRRQMPKLAALALAILVLASLFVPYGIFLVVALSCLVMVVMAFRPGRDARRPRSLVLDASGDGLQGRDEAGGVVARIDLRVPFTYEVLSKGLGSGTYQLRQAGERLTFSSEDALARYVVPDLLGLEWPPSDRRMIA